MQYSGGPPFCAKACDSGSDCPESCCCLSSHRPHCLPDSYQDYCCGEAEYWGGPGCGHQNEDICVDYGFSLGMICEETCSSDADCPETCCGTTTRGGRFCVDPRAAADYCE